MRRLNVLICITQLELGGAQQGTIFLAKHLDRRKFRVFFLSSPGELSTEALKIGNAKVILTDKLRREINLAQDFAAFRELCRIVKEEKIDIIHTNSSKAGILGRWVGWWLKVPVIIHTIHGWPFHDYQSAKERKSYVRLERWTARITTKLVAVAKANVAKGLREGIGKPEKYQVIHCGIDLSQFQPDAKAYQAVREEFNLPPEAKIVGMIACFKPQKSPLDFVQLAHLINKKMDGVYFLLVGDGELRGQIEKSLEKLDLKTKVILTGWRRDVPRLLASFDVLAHTSLWEGLPCVFSQAMALKIPIVATNVDGAPEAIINAQTGYLTPPRAVEEMAQHILFLLKNPAEIARMGEKSQQYLPPFDANLMVAEYDKLYTQLAQEKIKG